MINGFSNVFFGWGGEDDDLYDRVRAKGLVVGRYPLTLARYTMLGHHKDPTRVDGVKWTHSGRHRQSWDGLNSLDYDLVETERKILFTRILVSIDEARVLSMKGPT